MIEVRPVRTKKEQKIFLEFANKLYKGNEYFVPPLYMSEKDIFKKNYYYYNECEAEYFIAFKDGEPVGRISAFIQRASNEKTGEKRARSVDSILSTISRSQTRCSTPQNPGRKSAAWKRSADR